MEHCESCGQHIDPDQLFIDGDLRAYHKSCFNQQQAELSLDHVTMEMYEQVR